MAKTVRELITIQVGHYANFIGTHWWNLQEASFVYDEGSVTDINHDFLFREGITAQKQETYTPRLLSIDMKGNLGSLPVCGSLYNPIHPELSTNEASWHGQVELIRQLPEEKNEYLKDLEVEDSRYFTYRDEDKDICMEDVCNEQSSRASSVSTSQKIYDLSKSVRVWSDYLRPHLHHNTIYLIDEKLLQSGRVSSGEVGGDYGFNAGTKVFQREDIEEEITDRIRLLAESCGSLQGFQIMTDAHNAVGGVSQGILLHLEDEYRTKDSITFAATPPHLNPETPHGRAVSQASIVQSYSELSALSGAFVPLNLRSCIWDLTAPFTKWPHLTLEENNPYITSSILAACLDTTSLIYRSRSSPVPLAAVVDLLTLGGRKVAGASLAVPTGLGPSDYLFDWLKEGQKPQAVSVTGGSDFTFQPLSEVQVIRGIHPSKLVRPDTRLPPGVRYTSVAQLYQNYLEESRAPPNIRMMGEVQDPLKMSTPFPNVFNKNISPDGSLMPTACSSTPGARSSSCIGGLHQGGSMGHLLQRVLTGAQKLDVTKVPQLIDEGLDKDNWLAAIEELLKLKTNYGLQAEGMESSDDD